MSPSSSLPPCSAPCSTVSLWLLSILLLIICKLLLFICSLLYLNSVIIIYIVLAHKVLFRQVLRHIIDLWKLPLVYQFSCQHQLALVGPMTDTLKDWHWSSFCCSFVIFEQPAFSYWTNAVYEGILLPAKVISMQFCIWVCREHRLNELSVN